ncbi:Hypothetical protein NG00_01701 [Corynebacterium camporealensis]|uniref:Uncharacterized protein n=1 Tax=Corynebacterium camporealensis TaxID=161896 RepID=A0A0F6TC86_9CORY|nr:hypothetical protein [Corynebacterium camporealensis]AKE39824.1 hypothetical protein UL81_09400 [Corynebacterium camporealensis]AVH88941.1 Hypothetical protein NG00_01701 [Corynebacterium camporealensis]
MDKLSKWRLAALPLSVVISLGMALSSEILSIPLLVPLSLLPLIVGLVVTAPMFAVAAGWLYKRAFAGRITGVLIGSSLTHHARSIGLSVVLLFCVCVISTVSVGLASAGIGQASSGLSYWKPGMYTGSTSRDIKLADSEAIRSTTGVGTASKGRLIADGGNRPEAFVMTCEDYAEISADDPQCPATPREAILVPEKYADATFKERLVVPVLDRSVDLLADREIPLPALPVVVVPGLTEILITGSVPQLTTEGQFVYADSSVVPVDALVEIMRETGVGFTSQERIDNHASEMSSGYGRLALFLNISIVAFGLAAITGIVVAAIRDRLKLMEVLLLRGVEITAAKNLLRVETTALTLPFVVLGCAAGTVFAAAIASVSSLEPQDALTPSLLLVLILFLAAVPCVTELQLARVKSGGE